MDVSSLAIEQGPTYFLVLVQASASAPLIIHSHASAELATTEKHHHHGQNNGLNRPPASPMLRM